MFHLWETQMTSIGQPRFAALLRTYLDMHPERHGATERARPARSIGTDLTGMVVGTSSGGSVRGEELHSEDRAVAQGGRDLVIVTRVLAHYRVPLIARLTDLGLSCAVVVAGASHGVTWGDPGETSSSGVEVVRCSRARGWRGDVLRACSALAPRMMVIEHGARLDFAWTLLLSAAPGGAAKVLWTHGIENRERATGRRTLSGVARWLQLRLCDAVLCYDIEMAEQLTRRLRGKIVCAAPNSTDGAPIIGVFRDTGPLQRMSLKHERGLRHRFYLLGLGRLIPGKELGRLVDVLLKVRRVHPDTGLLLVGDGPERATIAGLASGRGLSLDGDVVFAGEILDRVELARWVLCADVHICPGYAGLNVVDALFAGLPTVLSEPGPRGPFHSPEWRYLRECAGGLFAPRPGNESLADVITTYFQLPDAERRMISESCAEYASSHLGMDPMAEGFRSILTALNGVAPVSG